MILWCNKETNKKKQMKKKVIGNHIRISGNAWRKKKRYLQVEFQLLTSTVCILILVSQEMRRHMKLRNNRETV